MRLIFFLSVVQVMLLVQKTFIFRNSSGVFMLHVNSTI